AALPPAKTTDQGIATVAGLAPGRYAIQAEFPGFETRVLKDVRVRTGDNKHVIVLPIQGLQDSVTVTRDRQVAAADRAQTFGTGSMRGGGRYNLRDGSLSGRSPFTPTKGPERTQNFGSNFGGTLRKDRASFNLSLQGSSSFETPNLKVALPSGSRSEALNLRS